MVIACLERVVIACLEVLRRIRVRTGVRTMRHKAYKIRTDGSNQVGGSNDGGGRFRSESLRSCSFVCVVIWWASPSLPIPVSFPLRFAYGFRFHFFCLRFEYPRLRLTSFDRLLIAV
jgi:hypothetical protein